MKIKKVTQTFASHCMQFPESLGKYPPPAHRLSVNAQGQNNHLAPSHEGLVVVVKRSGPHLSVYVRDGRGQLQSVQQVVPVVVVHLEVVQLKLLGRHLFLGLVDHPLQVLHDVAAGEKDEYSKIKK